MYGLGLIGAINQCRCLCNLLFLRQRKFWGAKEIIDNNEWGGGGGGGGGVGKEERR